MRSKTLSTTIYLLFSLALISITTIFLLLGCDEKHIDAPTSGPSAGSGAIGGGDTQRISLTASPSETITAIGEEQASAKITARVENQEGQPMPDGTVVYWSATVGTLDSATTTTSNGASTVTLTFPKSYLGCSRITATSGDAEAFIDICTVSVTATPTITPTPTPSTGFVVSASDPTIVHNEATTITAFVSTDGQPDANVQVNFSVSGAGILSESGDITDASGKASVILTGNNTSSSDQTATITATTTDGRSGTVSVVVTSGANPTATPTTTPTMTPTPTPTLTPTPTTTLTLGIVGQSSPYSMASGDTITLRAVADTDGVPDVNLDVTFAINAASTATGTFSVAPPTVATNGSGEAYINVEATAAGLLIIEATTADGRSVTITITVT